MSSRDARAKRGPRLQEVYSHSRLSSFEQCPRKFEYRYVLKLPAQSESIEGFVGKRVHEVIERLHIAVGRGRVPSLARVLQRFRILWEEQYDAERVRVVKSGFPVDFYLRSGERCLTHFYRRHYPFDTDETIGVEDRVLFELEPGSGYRVQGIIDRLARARDGAVEIHDYKTGQRVPSQSRLDSDRQLALYQIGVAERMGPTRSIRLVWHYLHSDQVRTSTRTPDQLGRLRRDTIALIDRIRAERRFEPRPSALCRWCEYADRCPAGPATRADAPERAPLAAEGPAEPVRRAPATAPAPPGGEQLRLL